MRSLLIPLLLAALAGAAACGGARKRGVVDPDFACKDRRIEYVETGGMMYAEEGVRLRCDGDVPSIERYFTKKDGQEHKQDGTLAAGAWDRAWQEFDSAGWRNLSDCSNPKAGDRDPVHTFEVSNGTITRTFMCPGATLPFPYEALRNAIDAVAAELPLDRGAGNPGE